MSGACEILGVLFGLLLILYTKRKWMYTGLFNIVGGLIAYSAWLIPIDSKYSEAHNLLEFDSLRYILFNRLFYSNFQSIQICVWLCSCYPQWCQRLQFRQHWRF